jgi:hypothetical protein
MSTQAQPQQPKQGQEDPNYVMNLKRNKLFISLILLVTLVQFGISIWGQLTASALNGCRLCQCSEIDDEKNTKQRIGTNDLYKASRLNFAASGGLVVFLCSLLCLDRIPTFIFVISVFLYIFLSFCMFIIEWVIWGVLNKKSEMNELLEKTQTTGYKSWSDEILGGRAIMVVIGFVFVKVWKDKILPTYNQWVQETKKAAQRAAQATRKLKQAGKAGAKTLKQAGQAGATNISNLASSTLNAIRNPPVTANTV